MQSVIKPSSKTVDVNAQIIANLDALNAAHLAKKPICFARGLPFYTCIDASKKIWTKETKDGKIRYIKRHLDVEKDVIVETVVEVFR